MLNDDDGRDSNATRADVGDILNAHAGTAAAQRATSTATNDGIEGTKVWGSRFEI
jgi:hypothetical protein